MWVRGENVMKYVSFSCLCLLFRSDSGGGEREGKGSAGMELGLTLGSLWFGWVVSYRGYLNNPEANARTLTSDGWLKTGDIARVDAEGYWYIVDRRKELIKYNGSISSPLVPSYLLLVKPCDT
jgi:acyl-CoA synthetase (AMP-forming)/AMP-acid ligase II